MSQNIYLIVFGTFGNPHGFRQSILTRSNESIQLNVKAFDLKTDAITLFPNSKVYAIRKDVVNGNKALSYSIYTYAKEKNSDRGGTFIGSSILFLNSIPSSYQIVNCLNELQNNLVSNNVNNDTIIVNHSDEFINLAFPSTYNNLGSNLNEIKDINFHQFTNNNAVVYVKTEQETLVKIFDKANALLNYYDTIYFTESREIATYAQKKGLFKVMELTNFEKEIQKVEEDKIKKLEASINELVNEKITLENEKLRSIENLRNLIDQSEKIHNDNKRRIDESRHELNEVNQRYQVFFSKIDDLIYRLQNGYNTTDIKAQHNENKRRFIDSMNQIKTNANINRFEAKKNKGDQQPYGIKYEETTRLKETENKSDNSYIFIGLNIFLFIALTATLIYFLWIKQPEIIISSEPAQQEIQTEIDSPSQNDKPSQIDKINIIDPLNNSELSLKEYRTIAKKIKYGMQLPEIVDIIFINSPNSIKTYYGSQKDPYSKLLVELNKNCFITEGNYVVFHQDTLRHIPSYKKPK